MSFIQEFIEKNGFGQYPKEYNKSVHGRYDPGRYYGKRDTPFGEVKLGELSQWLSRREKTPRAVVAAISRAHWRWHHAYMLPRKASAAALYQVAFLLSATFYVLNYPKKKYHVQYRYH